MMLMRTNPGLGAAATTSGLISATGSAAGGTLVSLATISGGAALKALGLTALAGPVGVAIGGAVALASTLLGAFGVGDGCGQTCVVASNNANQIEDQFKQNLAAFQSGEIDRATALSNANILWNAYVQMCHQVVGDQQTNCIADRQAGACKWRDSSGQCWNWFIGYIDPIQNSAPASAPTPALSSVLGNMTAAEWILLGLISWGVAEAVS